MEGSCRSLDKHTLSCYPCVCFQNHEAHPKLTCQTLRKKDREQPKEKKKREKEKEKKSTDASVLNAHRKPFPGPVHDKGGPDVRPRNRKETSLIRQTMSNSGYLVE